MDELVFVFESIPLQIRSILLSSFYSVNLSKAQVYFLHILVRTLNIQ